MQKKSFVALLKNIFLIQVFIVVLVAGVNIDLNHKLIQNSYNLGFNSPIININEQMAAKMFKSVNIGLKDRELGLYSSISDIVRQLPKNLVFCTLQALAIGDAERLQPEPGDDTGKDIGLPAISMEPVQNSQKADYQSIFKDGMVVFYCTHNAESYIPDSGKPRLDGEKGLINQVALNITDYLKSEGLNVVFIDKIHDYPDYQASYTNSRKTVQEVLESGEKVLALFDIHRDSIPGLTNAPKVRIGGRESAQILIIVGTDERKPHSHWEDNLEFAEKLYTQGELMYPGLIKGVRTKAGTYNQEYHEHSLLIEIGTDYNSFSEAKYAGELFADIVIEVLREEME